MFRPRPTGPDLNPPVFRRNKGIASSSFLLLVVMASNLLAMASTLVAMASNLVASCYILVVMHLLLVCFQEDRHVKILDFTKAARSCSEQTVVPRSCCGVVPGTIPSNSVIRLFARQFRDKHWDIYVYNTA